MNLQELLDFLNFIINKEQSGRFINPKEYTRVLQRSSYTFFKKYFDVPEEYQVGMPQSRIQWEITDTVKEKLSRFMVQMDLANANRLQLTNGFATKPTDMFYMDYFISPEGGVGRLRKGYQMDKAKQSRLVPPTTAKPVATERGDRFEFAPNTMAEVDFYYLRRPNDPVFDYYLDQNDNIIYLPPGQTSPSTGNPANHVSTSVELDWDVDCIWDIAQIILQDFGIGINRAEIVQYATQKESRGL